MRSERAGNCRFAFLTLTVWSLIHICTAHAEESHSSEHTGHNNHLAFIVGHAEEEQSDGHHESGNLLGFEYARKTSEHWRWGLVAEAAAFGSDHDRQGILAFPVSYFPNPNWRLFAAPGIEFREPGDPEHFMFRVGGGYEFRLGNRLVVSPEVEVDFVAGGTRVFVFALAFGFGF